MTSIETAQQERDVKKRSMLTKLAAGSLVVAGLLAAAIAPASADDDDWHRGHGKHHKKHWKHNHGYHYGYYQPRPPKVIYYQPAPVYYAPPPPVYYQPAPVYYYPEHRPRVSVDVVFPIRID